MLVVYLLVNCSFILIVSLISELVVVNISNDAHLKSEYKTEFYLMRDILFSISRCFGYLVLFLVASIFGMQYINYVMILCALAILIETIIIAKISQYS